MSDGLDMCELHPPGPRATDEREMQAIGERLKLSRMLKGLSVSEAAQRAGLSRSFLTRVEQGKSDIALGRLVRLVDIYGIKLGDLSSDAQAGEEILVRSGQAEAISSSAEGMALHVLVPTGNRLMTPTLATLAPDGHMVEHVRHEGEEFVLIIEGEVIVNLEGTGDVVLRQGDSLYFSATRGHAYRNGGMNPARFLSVVVRL
jgi:transcriptional regulator with XRE-family HTH domain